MRSPKEDNRIQDTNKFLQAIRSLQRRLAILVEVKTNSIDAEYF